MKEPLLCTQFLDHFKWPNSTLHFHILMWTQFVHLHTQNIMYFVQKFVIWDTPLYFQQRCFVLWFKCSCKRGCLQVYRYWHFGVPVCKYLAVLCCVPIHTALQQSPLLSTFCPRALPPDKITPFRTPCNSTNVYITSSLPWYVSNYNN